MSSSSKSANGLIPKKKPYIFIFCAGVVLAVASIVVAIIQWWNGLVDSLYFFTRYNENFLGYFFAEFFYSIHGYMLLVGIIAAILSIVLEKDSEKKVKKNKEKENGDSANIESLMRLKELLDSGVITQEEFDEKKEKLLK